jgi:hypothetical protein
LWFREHEKLWDGVFARINLRWAHQVRQASFKRRARNWGPCNYDSASVPRLTGHPLAIHKTDPETSVANDTHRCPSIPGNDYPTIRPHRIENLTVGRTESATPPPHPITWLRLKRALALLLFVGSDQAQAWLLTMRHAPAVGPSGSTQTQGITTCSAQLVIGDVSLVYTAMKSRPVCIGGEADPKASIELDQPCP